MGWPAHRGAGRRPRYLDFCKSLGVQYAPKTYGCEHLRPAFHPPVFFVLGTDLRGTTPSYLRGTMECLRPRLALPDRREQTCIENVLVTEALLIDDHPIVLEACKRVLESVGITDISVASSMAEGDRRYRAAKPEVIVVDLSMRCRVLEGIGFITRLRVHDKITPILVFSMHTDPMVVSRAFAVGASGYLLKAASAEEFAKAFFRVRAGQRYLTHELASDVAFSEIDAKLNPLSELSMREWQTLSLLADGRSYGAIANELHVSYKTVANTAAAVKIKLGAKSIPDLMRIAITHLPGEPGRRIESIP